MKAKLMKVDGDPMATRIIDFRRFVERREAIKQKPHKLKGGCLLYRFPPITLRRAG
jgi:hypothetical protein